MVTTLVDIESIKSVQTSKGSSQRVSRILIDTPINRYSYRDRLELLSLLSLQLRREPLFRCHFCREAEPRSAQVLVNVCVLPY